MGTCALRYLTEHQPIEVETDDAGTPIAVTVNGRRRTVDCVREEWLIQDLWWTEEPVARRYIDLVLDNGRQLEVYHLPSGWTISTHPASCASVTVRGSATRPS